MGFEDLRGVFCDELIRQELDDETAEIPIRRTSATSTRCTAPRRWCAYCLEEKLEHPGAHLLQVRGQQHLWLHKLNSPLHRRITRRTRASSGVTTETGAGQWGTALSMACAYLGLDCKVYMVKCFYEQKPFRREVDAHLRRLRDAEPLDGDGGRQEDTRGAPGTTGSLAARFPRR